MALEAVPSSYCIVSDGSASASGDRGAAACIVEEEGEKGRVKLVSFLGVADSTDTEVFAGLLGLAYIKLFSNHSDQASVTWISDNQTVLEAATTRVYQWRNSDWLNKRGSQVRKRGLWEAFLYLSSQFSINTVHSSSVKSCSAQHRACDRASRWVEQKGTILLSSSGEGPIGRISKLYPSRAWLLIDGREIIGALRRSETVDDTCQSLEKRLGRQIAPKSSKQTPSSTCHFV